MRKDINKALVGGFVVGALALVVFGVVIFGSGDFFKRKVEYVLYFDSSVQGLKVGSPVFFRGVEIGAVAEISLIADAQKLSFEIPVYIEVEPTIFQVKKRHSVADLPKDIDRFIANGLRAQLKTQSMLTGQLMIELDFHDDKPAVLRGTGEGPPEIPTIPSTLDSLVQTIKDLNLDETTRNLTRMLAGIEDLVNSSQLSATMDSLQQTIDSTNNLIDNLDSRLGPVLDSVEQTVQTAGGLMRNLDGQITPLSGTFQDTAQAATSTIEHAEQTLDRMDAILSQDSQVVYQLNSTLNELSAAARSIKTWADYMERHPEALLRGKK
jgi:paraquat-inducible protein B